MSEQKKRVVEVPAHDYEPTKAEMEETVTVGDEDTTFEDAVKHFLRPPGVAGCTSSPSLLPPFK